MMDTLLNNILTGDLSYVYIGLFIVLYGLILSYKTIKEIIRIHRTPTDHVSALLSEDQVEVVGKAEGQIVHSPITKKACVFWQVYLSEYNRGVGSYYSTRTSTEPFVLNDGTGKIQITPEGAELVLRNNLHQRSNFFSSFNPQTKAVLEELGMVIRRKDNIVNKIVYGSDKNVYERYIEPGDQIFVSGKIKYEDGVRSIASDDDIPLVIGNSTEQQVLGKLYGIVLRRVLVGVLIVVFGFVHYILSQ